MGLWLQLNNKTGFILGRTLYCEINCLDFYIKMCKIIVFNQLVDFLTSMLDQPHKIDNKVTAQEPLPTQYYI